MGTALRGEPVRSLSPPEGVVSLPTGWRYSEWAEGGFLAELGLDDTPIDRSLIPTPPVPGASEPNVEDTLRSFIERLFN
jgi:penicillin-binding protein 1A